MVDSVGSSDKVLSLQVVDSSVFEFAVDPPSMPPYLSRGFKSGMSTSVLNKFIIGKRCLMH